MPVDMRPQPARLGFFITTAVVLICVGMRGCVPASLLPPAACTTPTPRKVVIVIEENHGFSQIMGNPDAPYINRLASEGANFTESYAVWHPSEPNYLALFSGRTFGITDDRIHPHALFTTPN